MVTGLTVRSGMPNLRRRVETNQPVHILVFGSSITHEGFYLQPLLDELKNATGHQAIHLTRLGLWGFSSAFAAFRLESEVLTRQPDVVLLEHAVNDTFMIDDVPHALHAMIQRIRAAYPQCDIGFVYFAPDPETDQQLAIRAHEAIAEYYGLASINMAEVAAERIRRGEAVLMGSEDALTRDGVHQNPSAASLLGEPFAKAMLEILTSDGLPAPPQVAAIASPFERARAVSAASLVADETWSVAPPPPDAEPSGAYTTSITSARIPGATLTFSFTGFYLLIWAKKAGGSLDITIDGDARRIALPEKALHVSEWEAVKIPLRGGGGTSLNSLRPDCPSHSPISSLSANF